MELKKYKLGEFIENYGDGIHGTPKYDTDGDYYFINGNNLLDGKITINNNTLKVSENEYQKIYRPIINGRTILISINGTLGRLAIYRGEKICLGKSACYINLKDSKYISFILYVLKSKEFSIYMNRVAGQSTIKNVSPKQIINYEFFAPKSLENCLNFGNLLSTLDQKIALNRKINDNLEAMAKQLYDYWFVQFDFPNEEGKPYKSSGGKMVWNDKLKREIPAIFKASFLGELCCFRNGINYVKDEIGEQFEIINVRNISSSKILLDGESFDTISVPASRAGNYIVKDNDIIIARSGCPGSTRLLLSPSNILFCGFIICCTPNEPVMRSYLTYCLKQLEGTSATTSGGSILQNVSQDTLKSLCVAQPTIDVLEKFNDTISSLFTRMLNCLTENKMLIKQRDELLPLLMNGQVSVNYD